MAFCEAMPRVHPCYAVKCNPNDGMLAVLASIGAGFDCASEVEIEKVRGAGQRNGGAVNVGRETGNNSLHLRCMFSLSSS